MMSLLESVVLFDVMQVISSKSNGISHLCGENDTPVRYKRHGEIYYQFNTYLKILPLIETSEVNGHLWST